MNMKKAISCFCSKVKEVAVKTYETAKKHTLELVAAASALVPASSVMVVCANTEKTLITKVLGLIFKIFKYIGVLLLAWSIGMLVLAFKNEDADSKSRAIMMMVVSVVLITIEPLFNTLGVLNNL